MRTLGHREGNNTHRAMLGGGGRDSGVGVWRRGKDNTGRNA